jgi:hypothetical protein
MSDFLSNVARRGAGLPVSPIRLSAQVHFGRGLCLRAAAGQIVELPAIPGEDPVNQEPGPRGAMRRTSGVNGNPASATHVLASLSTPVTMSAPVPNAAGATPTASVVTVPMVALGVPPREPALTVDVAQSTVPVDSPLSSTVLSEQSAPDAGREASLPPPLTGAFSFAAEDRTQIDEGGGKPAAAEVTKTIFMQAQPREPVAMRNDASAPSDKSPAPAAARSQQTTAIRPAPMPAPFTQFPRSGKTDISEQAPPTIHVKIGRIEVRGKIPPASAPQPPKPAVAPLGFARYARQRMYRNWPL